MNSVFTAKLLQNLRNKKEDKGFTLIELLVVVIIIGVLAAVALPNLLGQVGKAREAEAKNGVGSITRALQGFHFEARNFPAAALAEADFQDINNVLSLSLVSEFYDYSVTASTNDTAYDNSALTGGNAGTGADDLSGAVTADANNPTANGIREFATQIAFNAATGNYGMAVCQENGVNSAAQVAVGLVSFTDPSLATCANGILLR